MGPFSKEDFQKMPECIAGLGSSGEYPDSRKTKLYAWHVHVHVA